MSERISQRPQDALAEVNAAVARAVRVPGQNYDLIRITDPAIAVGNHRVSVEDFRLNEDTRSIKSPADALAEVNAAVARAVRVPGHSYRLLPIADPALAAQKR